MCCLYKPVQSSFTKRTYSRHFVHLVYNNDIYRLFPVSQCSLNHRPWMCSEAVWKLAQLRHESKRSAQAGRVPIGPPTTAMCVHVPQKQSLFLSDHLVLPQRFRRNQMIECCCKNELTIKLDNSICSLLQQ